MAIQADPPSLSEILVSERSSHTSSRMECVALQQMCEHLRLLSTGKFIALLKMSLWFSPVSPELIDLFS